MESSPAAPSLELLLHQSREPLPAKSLQTALSLKPKQWKALLADAVAKGIAKAWPKGRYWHISPNEAIAASIPLLISVLQQSDAPLTEAELASRMDLPAPEGKPVLKAALAANNIVKWPKSRYWHMTETQAVRRHLLDALQSASLPANRLEQATPAYSTPKITAKVLKEMLTAGAVVLAYTLPPADLSLQLLDAVKQLQVAPGVPVPVRDLRARVAAPKPDFDRAALALADRQQVYLTTHDHGWALPAAEQDILIHDGGNKLYVAVTLRD